MHYSERSAYLLLGPDLHLNFKVTPPYTHVCSQNMQVRLGSSTKDSAQAAQSGLYTCSPPSAGTN